MFYLTCAIENQNKKEKPAFFAEAPAFFKSYEPLLRESTKLLTALNVIITLFRVVNKLHKRCHHHQNFNIMIFLIV